MSTQEFIGTLDKSESRFKNYLNNAEKITKNDMKNHINDMAYSFDLASIKAKLLDTAMNALAGIGIALVIKGVTALADYLIVTQEELSETATTAAQAVDDTESQIEDINTQLDENNDRISELKKLGTLTYVEKAELNNLKEANKLLNIQKETLEETLEAQNISNAIAQDEYVQSLLNPSFMDNFKNIDWGNAFFGNNTTQTVIETADYDSLLTIYDQLIDKKEEMLETEDYDQDTIDNLGLAQERLTEYMQSFSEAKSEMEAGYQAIINKQIDGKALTTSEQAVIENYEKYSDYIDEIYKKLDPAGFKEYKFEEIFDTEGLELTEDELIDLAKAGSLVELDLSQYRNLQKAIDDSGISVFDFKSQLVALADDPVSSISALTTRTESLAETIKNAEDNVESFLTAVEESNGATGLSSDSITAIEALYSGLDSYDADKLFERTANGIHLNSDELERLNDLQRESKKQKYEDHLKELTEEYKETCKELANFNGTLEDRNDLLDKRDALEAEIEETRDLQAQYNGLTSAYNGWLKARETENDGAMYDEIRDGYEDMLELAQNGDWGTDDLEEYIRLLTGVDTSSMDASKTEEYWKKAKKIQQKYFTEDDNVGLMNFLQAAEKANAGVKQLKDGSWSLDVDTEELAEKMGVSVEIVEAIFKKLVDKKWDINIGDSVDNLDLLKSSAEEAYEELKKISDNQYTDIDLNVENVDDVKTEISKVEGYLEDATDPKQIEYLNELLDYLEVKLGSIDDSSYTGVKFFKDMEEDISDVKKSYEVLKNELDDGVEIKFDSKTVEDVDKEIEKITKEFVIDGKFDVDADGAEEATEVLSYLLSQKITLEEPAIMEIELDDTQAETELGKGIALVQEYQNAVNELNLENTLNKEYGFDINTKQAEDQVSSLLTQIQALPDNVQTDLGIDPTSVESINQTIANMPIADIKATLKTQSDEAIAKVQAYNAEVGKIPAEKQTNITVTTKGQKNLEKILEYQKSLKNKEVTYTITTKNKTSSTNTAASSLGTSSYRETKAKGTGHSSGSAFARGDWQVKNSSRALTGELGAEVIVRDGKWFTVGDNGAEFVDIKKGDIIFDHIQTEQLLHGKNVANSFASGSALLSGTAYSTTVTGGGSSLTANKSKTSSKKKTSSSKTKSSSSKTKSSSSKSKTSSTEDDFEESMDWIEIAIDRIERAIDSLARKAESVYSSWSSRNKNLTSEMSTIQKQIATNTKGYEAYMKKANSVGLSEAYKKKVRNGTISIQDITDEDLKDKIDQYEKWFECAIELKESTEELNEQLKELAQQKFDNVVQQYEDILSTFEAKSDAIETIIETQELKGYADSAKYYQTLLSTNSSTLANLEKEKAALLSSLNEAVNKNGITEGSEAWYEMKQEIDDVQQSIYEAEQTAQELKNTIEEISWDRFDSLQDKISDIVNESEFLNELLSDEEMFDDRGNLTNAGQSSMALYGINYNTYMNQADQYAQALKELDEEYKNDSLNERYLERRQELVETQRELILNAEEEKQNMIELKSDGYDKMLDALDELIDKRKELLDTTQEYYDYEKEIAEKTKEVTTLQKKLAAFSTDDSEEAKKTVKELKVELQEAKDDLNETEYDKYISDQEAMLDNLSSEAEAWVNERLDNVDALLQSIIDEVNQDSGTVSETIRETADSVGYTLSSSMDTILGESGSNITTPITTIISTYGDTINGSLTSINAAINSIITSQNKQTEKANTNATTQLKTATTNSNAATTASKSTVSTSSTSTKSSSTSSNSSSSSNNLKSIFSTLKYTGNKSKLNRYSSIVDALKYYDYNSSHNKRKEYYKKLFGDSSYTGTSAQNIKMLKKFRSIMGYSTGGLVGELQKVAQLNGDNLVSINTLKKGESVFDTSTTEQLIRFNQNADKFANLMDLASIPTSGGQTIIQQSFDGLTIELPNVTDFADFKYQLMNDGDFRKYVFSVTDSNYSGTNKLAYKKYIK